MSEIYRFSTDTTPPERAFVRWVEQIQQNIAKFSIKADDSYSFVGSLLARDIGQLRLSMIQASRQEGVYDCRGAGQDPDRMDLSYLCEGQLLVRQGGVEQTVSKGDFILINHRERFAFSTQGDSRGLNISLPMLWLRNWLPDPEDCAMKVITPGSNQWARSLAILLDELGNNFGFEAHLPDQMLTDHIGTALALVFDQPPKGNTPRWSKSYRQMVAIMRCELSDSSLSPHMVASMSHMSVRRLHMIFASEGTTFRRELRRLRLDKAQQLLKDPRYSRRTIGEVAQLCGFDDPAYLARCFKDAFGCPPSAFRFQNEEADERSFDS